MTVNKDEIRHIDKAKFIDYLNESANELHDKGAIVPAGCMVILRDAAERGEFDAPPDAKEETIRRLSDANDDLRSRLSNREDVIRQQAEEIEKMKQDLRHEKRLSAESERIADNAREALQQSEEARKAAERERDEYIEITNDLAKQRHELIDEVDDLKCDNTALRECLESMLMSGFVDFERAQTLLAELDRHTEGTSLAAESVRHPYRGTMHYSRRESNFINRMDHSDRDHYIKQFIAACNSKQLMPFIKIVSHDKNWREVDYVVDIPNPPELDRKDTQPKEGER